NPLYIRNAEAYAGLRGQTGLAPMHPISQKAMTSLQTAATVGVFVFLAATTVAGYPQSDGSLTLGRQANSRGEAQSASSGATQTSAPSSQSRDQASQKDGKYALPRGKKLMLKDGTFQLVRSYERKGDRVRYYSVERGAWDEIPA